jgi:hypothetical protein
MGELPRITNETSLMCFLRCKLVIMLAYKCTRHPAHQLARKSNFFCDRRTIFLWEGRTSQSLKGLLGSELRKSPCLDTFAWLGRIWRRPEFKNPYYGRFKSGLYGLVDSNLRVILVMVERLGAG